MIAFSLLKTESVKNIQSLVHTIHLHKPPEVPKFLVGTQYEQGPKNVVKKQEQAGMKIAKKLGLTYFSIDAQTGLGVNELKDELFY